MRAKMINEERIPRAVKSAGAGNLRVVSLCARCGDIRNGIAFEFDGEGGWVVDLKDLKRIVEQADELKA